MQPSSAIHVAADGLAAVVDAKGTVCKPAPGASIVVKTPVVQEKSMGDSVGAPVGTHHLAAVVDAEDLGFPSGPGRSISGEDPVFEQKPVGESSGGGPFGIDVRTHHLAAVIDLPDGGERGGREIDGGEDTPSFPHESMAGRRYRCRSPRSSPACTVAPGPTPAVADGFYSSSSHENL